MFLLHIVIVSIYSQVISNIDFLESELHFVENNELAMRNRLL